MTFLPIVSRELRLASRRRSTYWLRSIAALIVMIIGTWLFLIMQGAQPRELAMALFCVLTGGAVLFALVSGPRSTADSISEEKREGTLGLLFLTDLKGYDVVLGKMAVGSINAFYSIVAILPMLAIPLLLGGGITLAEFGRMALVTVNTLFFSLSLGICVSTVNRSAQKAAAVTSLLIALLAFGFPACGEVVATLRKSRSLDFLFLTPSAGFSYYLAFDAPYRSSKPWFWISVGILNGCSWLCLILASLIAPRCWQDRPSGQGARPWSDGWREWTYGSAQKRAAFRQRVLDINPVYWLIARIQSKTAAVWFFLGALAAIWALGWWRFHRDWLNEVVYVTTAIAVNIALRYWFAGEAARSLAENRKAGALELLLSTPLTVSDILRGHWLALKRQFLVPVLVVLLVEVVFMFATVRDAVGDEDRYFWSTLWIAGILMFVADLITLYWIGMWQGLTAKNPLRAAGGALTRVMVLPWIAYGLILLIMVLREFIHRAYQSNPTWKHFLGLWFVLGIGMDIAFGVWAWRKLRTDFRLAAQQRQESTAQSWKRRFGKLKRRVSATSAPELDLDLKA
jgi:ABC-type transport system involved in multi-copper enzyme maturation permease subunit